MNVSLLLRRLASKLLVSATVAVGIIAGTSLPANASTAYDYGFTCQSNYNWLRQNWPNISTDSSTTVEVYTRSYLYRWTSSGWTYVTNSPWYVGVSNNTGRKALGNVGGVPYYFALNNGVAPLQGHVYGNLADGYYRTAEQYSVNGVSWWKYSYVSGTNGAQGYCAL